MEKTIDNIEDVNVEPIISDIAIIRQSINDISNDFLTKFESNLSKINEINSKNILFANKLSNISQDISSLHSEDEHIFREINKLKQTIETILSDNVLLKEENTKINYEIQLLKQKIDNIGETKLKWLIL